MNNKIVKEINRRSLLFVVDNPKFSGHRIAIESVMMIGASIVLEQEAEETGRLRELSVRKEDELLKNLFQPSCGKESVSFR